MIQFACPTCKATCSVDDRLAGRKMKCPKCGARVIHVRDGHVELLSAGSAPPPGPAASAGAPPPAPGEATPLATAVVPHSVGEFVGQSESMQNFYIGAGLVVLFAAILSVVGIVMDLRLLAVVPIAILLTVVAVWLWLRTQRLKRKIVERQKAGAVPRP